MNPKENFLRAAEFRGPEWIPCSVSLSPPIWHIYREKLEEVILRHPSIFGNYRKGSVNFDDFGIRRRGNIVEDEWGCLWSFPIDGLQGQVIRHPLSDWRALESYQPKDPIALNALPAEGYPLVPGSFEASRKALEEAKASGRLAVGSCPHGFVFQRLYYLRGFENLMKDLILEPPELRRLLGIILRYNLALVQRWLNLGVDAIFFGDDLGAQDRLTVSPQTFRKWILPVYEALFRPVREAGAHVHLHSDGHVLEVAEDLVKAFVTILNIQDLVNGIEAIGRLLKGKICVDLDIDRQRILPFGRPEEVRRHISKVVSELNSKDGGLMLTIGIYPPTPLENIEALCEALEATGAGIKY
ncbi:MAG: uroporphyrinogen decarboxylase family protein [Candidatus Bathyarchaeia archaeon]